MLQLVEMEGKMTENGCIEIPAVVLEQAGICTGDTVKLVYMAEDGEHCVSGRTHYHPAVRTCAGDGSAGGTACHLQGAWHHGG